jgi:GH24 family phage-related lysozyme (muramidase)
MELSDKGTQVLVDREGLALEAYQDSEGYWTIGVGHAETSGRPPIPCEGMTITEDQALAIFDEDNDVSEAAVAEAITRNMQQHQLDAFVSICHNIGESAFRGATFVERFNAHASDAEVVEAILWWDEPPEIVSRRQGEAVQFRDAVYVARIHKMPPPRDMS